MSASRFRFTIRLALAFGIGLTGTALAQQPPPPPKSPVTETFFGQSIADDWRGMEALDPATLDWMRMQGAYTRRLLDSIKPLPALRDRLAAFTAGFGFVDHFSAYGGRLVYTERAPGSDAYDLMARDEGGAARKIIDVAALRAAHGGAPFAIDYVLASPDGSKVLAEVSKGGSEQGDFLVFDAASGRQIAGPLDRGRFGPTAWSADSRHIFLLRNKALASGEPATDFERFVQAQVWDLQHDPVPLAGAGSGRGPAISPDEWPGVYVTPGSNLALMAVRAGTKNELRLLAGDARRVDRPEAAWAPLAGYADGITAFAVRGDRLYLLSHKDAPTFQVLELRAGEPLSAARVLVPARPDRVLANIAAGSDGLYVETREGVYSHLLRLASDSGSPEEIALPVHGQMLALFADPRRPGVVAELSSWVDPGVYYRFDPVTRTFADLNLGARGSIRAADFEVRDLKATAHDGVQVPLSLIVPRGGSPGPSITVVEAYGSFGIPLLAGFAGRRASFMEEGIAYAVCHVRGGGELGDAWRLAGKDENKPNTWRDLIACGDDLIARGVTDRSKLFILGGSAGGIAMGRAMEERPDLFAGVLDMVPQANSLRAEFSPNGPPNVGEFGSVKTEAGFQNLLAMDSVANVKPGVAYPPVMISTGLNDPRVAPWQPAKFAAALMASGTPNPVLLRIDEQAGHGQGATKTQGDRLNADQIAFIFWRAGLPEWRPTVLP